MTLKDSCKQRSPSQVAAVVDARLVLHQRLHHLDVPAVDGSQYRRHPVVVTCADVRAVFQQHPDEIRVSAGDGSEKGSPTVLAVLGVDEGSFWSGMQNNVQFGHDVVNGIIKSIVFALLCTWIAVFQGYACDPTPEGIATAMTRTVVYSSLCVLGFDFVLTAVMFGGI